MSTNANAFPENIAMESELVSTSAEVLGQEAEAYLQQVNALGNASLDWVVQKPLMTTAFEELSVEAEADPTADVPEAAYPGRTKYTMPTGPETDFRAFDL